MILGFQGVIRIFQNFNFVTKKLEPMFKLNCEVSVIFFEGFDLIIKQCNMVKHEFEIVESKDLLESFRLFFVSSHHLLLQESGPISGLINLNVVSFKSTLHKMVSLFELSLVIQ